MSHGGGCDGMYSCVALLPGAKLGMIVLTNSMTGISSALMYKIIDFYLDKDDRDWSAEFWKGNSRIRKRKKKNMLN